MHSQRQSLLNNIIDDPHSTDAERQAAQKELNPQVSQNTQDAELERYWSEVENRSMPERSQLSSSTQAVLEDLGRYILGLSPREGAVDRLTTLLAATGSDFVRQKVTWIWHAINHQIDSGRIKQ